MPDRGLRCLLCLVVFATHGEYIAHPCAQERRAEGVRWAQQRKAAK